MSKKLSPKAGPWLNVLHISNNGIDEQSTETSIDSCETFQFIKRLVVKFNMTFNHFHNILRLSDVTNFFLSPPVKRCAIITYKRGIYELPHDRLKT